MFWSFESVSTVISLMSLAKALSTSVSVTFLQIRFINLSVGDSGNIETGRFTMSKILLSCVWDCLVAGKTELRLSRLAASC